MKTKIIVAFLLLVLTVGIVCASQADDLKAPAGYEDMAGGISEKLDNRDVYFYIGEMKWNENVFDNNTNQTVSLMEDNIYKFVDTNLNDCGVQEKVKMDGKEYLVSIVDESGVDGDFDGYLNSLKEFNKINSLVPMAA